MATCSLMEEASCNCQILTLILRLGKPTIHGFSVNAPKLLCPQRGLRDEIGPGEVGGLNLVERAGPQKRV